MQRKGRLALDEGAEWPNERYELSVFPSGEFLGRPEDAFQSSAEVYLS